MPIKQVNTELLLEEIKTDGHAPLKFICDDGLIYYCKHLPTMHRAEINCLAYEVIANYLLQQLTIPTPEIALVEVTKGTLIKSKITKNKRDVKTGNTNDKKVKEKVLKYFNLRSNGEYNLTENHVNSFDYQIEITENFKNGYLLICYNESGYINRIKVSELLKKQRNIYRNGIYGDYKINRILITNSEAIIGIIYHKGDTKYFKAILLDQLKNNNGKVGLQGYKTMSDSYDNLEYLVLPIELKNKLSRLIFKSFSASGKSFDNSNYKKEFTIINSHSNNIEFKLF